MVFLCGAGTYVPGVPPLEAPLGERLPLVSVIPFVLLLVAIALLPVFAGSWWEANANKGKVAALFALPLAGLMVFHFGWTGLEAIVDRLFEYISLIALLGSLYPPCAPRSPPWPSARPAVISAYAAINYAADDVLNQTILQETNVPLVTQSLTLVRAGKSEEMLLEEDALLNGDCDRADVLGRRPPAVRSSWSGRTGPCYAQALPDLEPVYRAYFLRTSARRRRRP